MIGQSIANFHANPEPIRQLLADESNLPYKGRIDIGKEILLLTATAIYDHQKKRIGTMASWSLATESENLMKSLKGSSVMVSSASAELTESSQAMRATAEETSQQAKTVAEISEHTNQSVQSVAAAAGEMAVTVKEIAKNVQEANQISASAVSKADTMNMMITKLDESGAAIGKIIKVISKIAGQTNLLALNATIEAARAGQSGKGFAVVAGEVKVLAKETEDATSEIRSQISTIQDNTKNAVDAIAEISEIIKHNQEIAIVIAGAVEEQAATTDDISRNMAGAAKGTDDVVKEIESILNAAIENARGADNIQAAAQQLAQMAHQLADLTGNQSEKLEKMSEEQSGDIELF